MNNLDLRATLKENGVCQWEVADFMGVSEMTIVRKLRKELVDAEKQRFRAAITVIAATKAGCNYAENANA